LDPIEIGSIIAPISSRIGYAVRHHFRSSVQVLDLPKNLEQAALTAILSGIFSEVVENNVGSILRQTHC
jgi:hypothetical protein